MGGKNINFEPCGFKVLVETIDVVMETKSGIVINSEQFSKRESHGMDMARILKFGPIAYKGYSGCDGPADWGVKVGDLVEFMRNNGKLSRLALDNPECANWRIINDSDIIGVITSDVEDEYLLNN
tara:strand:- start:2217 stop:2591 length:375 start_codon:yes stop_codon:yes gene_type:complete